ncbi:HK97 gp10 family phage protein [Sphingopyxis sp. J-6]|uniref:HK97 gp10 family phage protein n=1 Tax=Sphingopyxis sp. J-6 TaxID=3122054 RepID=UPI00398409AF
MSRGLRMLARPDELDTIKQTALFEAGEPIRDAAKLNAPFDEGRLFSAIDIEILMPSPRRVPTYAGVAVWVRYTNDYRPLKGAVEGKGKRRGRGKARDYQTGSIPVVYGAFQEFGTKHMDANPWMAEAWASEGRARAVARIRESLSWSLMSLVRRRLAGR